MTIIILTLLNFVIATGMLWVVYYKWYKSDERKDLKLKEYEKEIDNLTYDHRIQDRKINILKTTFISLNKEKEEYKRMLSKFKRKRNLVTGKFIKSSNE